MEISEINKIGKELELYTSVSYIGKGFPIVLPRGAKVIKIIRDYVEAEEEKAGYKIVRTPSVSKAEIYKMEDRYDTEKKNLFVINKDEDEEINDIVLRPYSQPFHCSVYNTKQRIYKELPIKYSETSTVYRNEKNIKGISRTRQITMSDASIFSTAEDLVKQIKESMKLQLDFINKMELDVNFAISDWDDTKKEEYIGRIDEWENTYSAMKEALDDLKINYTEDKKAKMYGPSIKMDYNGKEFSTLQVDFEIVHRFETKYVNKNNEDDYPIYMHRTSVGSYESLLSILIEKYQGEFPLWMAPNQVVLIPEGEEFDDYVKNIYEFLVSNRIRTEIDNSMSNVQNKEYKAIDLKIPYIIKVGKEELNSKTINVRKKDEIRKMKIEELVKEVQNCQTKS